MQDRTQGPPLRPTGLQGWWPWPPTPDPPEYPVLLVPGLCGTILHVKKKGDPTDKGTRVWVCINHADSVYQQLWGRFNAKTGLIEELLGDIEVVVPEGTSATDGGLYAIDVLDPDVYLPLHIIYYYRAAINSFTSAGYTAGKDLFGFGYDFRQSNRQHCEPLQDKLEAISKACGGRRVNVVTHSMGGLIAKLLLAQKPEDFERLVNKWVAIACPFNGAPGFVMDALLTGVQFAWGWEAYFFVERTTMWQMCLQAPAVYELYPTADFRWPKELGEPTVTVWAMEDGQKTVKPQVYDVKTYRGLLRESLRNNSVQVNGENVAMPMNEDLWAWSEESKRIMASARLPATCKFYNIYGAGFPTAFNVTYATEKYPIASVEDIPNSTVTFVYADGDSTVPVCSASADGLDAEERLEFKGEHRQLIEQPLVWEQVFKWLHVKENEDAGGRLEDDWVLVSQPEQRSHRWPPHST